MGLIPIYSDINADFTQDSKGSLALVTDRTSIEQSWDTILMTPYGSKKFDPTFGASIDDILFELVSVDSAIALENELRRAITKGDPRATISSVSVTPYPDEHRFDIAIAAFVQGFGEFEFAAALRQGEELELE